MAPPVRISTASAPRHSGRALGGEDFMNKHGASARGELLRLGAAAVLVPPLALLVQLAHAYVHGSEDYFLDNAAILRVLDPVGFAMLSVVALITFCGLLALRRFSASRWKIWAVLFCFTALWAYLLVCGESKTRAASLGPPNPHIHWTRR